MRRAIQITWEGTFPEGMEVGRLSLGETLSPDLMFA
jgi:hypothetical protein